MSSAEPESNANLEDALQRITDLETERDALAAACDQLRQEGVTASDFKRVEDDLQESHDSQRLILGSSPFGVSIISQQNPDRRLFANQRMAEMFGYASIDEMLRYSAADSYVDVEDLARLRQSGKDGVFMSEAVMERFRKDGSRWWCLLYRRPAVFEGEAVVIAWHNDITSRKLAEDALKASEARYSAVVDGQSELITRFTPDGKFTFVNAAYCWFTGKTEEEILKGSIFDDVPNQDMIRLNRYFSTFSKDLPVQSIENKLQRRDGQLRDIEWTDTATFDEDGSVTEFLSVARDITERRRARQALELAKQQAQEANAAKSSFLATMSHEIRTPLNGVLGLAQLLRDTELDIDQRKKVDTILSSGQTLLSIINDVLDMSKIEAGGLELEEAVFSLQDLLATVATPFQSLADDRGLKLRVTNGFDSEVILKGDPVRLRQILWNLLSNAIKFTTEGSVVLSIKNAREVGKQIANLRDYAIMFSVTDTGTGISEDRVSSIFDAFTQEDSSITRKFGGTGLGLSIVKQLTEMMGGSIEVTSELDKGTTFTAYLPFVAATAEEAEKITLTHSDAAMGATRPMKVLVAEDNAVNTMIAKAFLEKAGHTVRHAENGQVAVDIAAENWADLILMDIHMPEMDGVEATKIIRASKEGARIPIVGLTAEAFSERHAHFRAAGMDDVLTKPFTELQLSQILAQYDQSPIEPKTADEIDAVDDKQLAAAVSSTPEGALAAQLDEISYASLPIGDLEALNGLLSHMPADVQSSLFEQAEISINLKLADLKLGIEEEHAERIFEAAHAIKGSSGSMFAVKLVELAAVTEDYVNDQQSLAILLPMMEDAAEETLVWWKTIAS